MNETDSPAGIADDFGLSEMTTTELHALLLTVRLTAAEMRAIRAELRGREI